ncbi:hypothetical protein [Massilia sp. BJB1822]|uniref:hypothetical protein n=1 Tax=Massilia sp. BJB1822 TaxID=2744470 RepID=UPI001594AA61|nr:hypothetical protein [Massilia sp. BJB1822]NVD98832.1 hypothetical protein [Massilia sp. BJB1822]
MFSQLAQVAIDAANATIEFARSLIAFFARPASLAAIFFRRQCRRGQRNTQTHTQRGNENHFFEAFHNSFTLDLHLWAIAEIGLAAVGFGIFVANRCHHFAPGGAGEGGGGIGQAYAQTKHQAQTGFFQSLHHYYRFHINSVVVRRNAKVHLINRQGGHLLLLCN